MINFLLASGNIHKAQEFKELLAEGIVGVEVDSKKIDVEEVGKSFQENSFLKALAYFNTFKRPVISDDSGIVIESLPNELGIYSARFGGEGIGDKERAQLVLEKMKGVENRKAYFVCVLCVYLSEDEHYFFEGRVLGEIGKEYVGDGGFGYDPIFIPQKYDGEDTLAMIPEWKKNHSHRAAACRSFTEFFKERDCQNL